MLPDALVGVPAPLVRGLFAHSAGLRVPRLAAVSGGLALTPAGHGYGRRGQGQKMGLGLDSSQGAPNFTRCASS